MILDHVGIAVENLEEGIAFYEKALGLEVVHREDVPSQKVKVAFLRAGEISLELLEPTGNDGAIAKFLKTRGPGLHHLAFETSKIGEEMKRLNAAGLPTLETAPRPGARGHQVCFLHPRNCHGTLIELVQPAH
ncbi:MAG: methylmalonyl-CoA epimerase [Elusimicrobiota bacterium]